MKQPSVAEKILNAFQKVGGSYSAATFASMFNVPEPSICRSIQQLRAQGHNIAFAWDNLYAYRAPEVRS